MKIINDYRLLSIEEVILKYNKNKYVIFLMNKRLSSFYFRRIMDYRFDPILDSVGFICRIEKDRKCITPVEYVYETSHYEYLALRIDDIIEKNNKFYFRINEIG